LNEIKKFAKFFIVLLLLIFTMIKQFFNQSRRVWKLLKKPTREEFVTISKVSAIGLCLVGVLGFTINLLMTYLGLS